MYEKRIPHPLVKDVEWHDVPPFVMITHLKDSEDTLKKFMEDCQKILVTGQTFLPVMIDSFGGHVYTSLGIVDFLNGLDEVEVVTICTTKAMSGGVIVFSAGKRRFASPSATFMVHEVSSVNWGKNVEIQNEAKETERLNKLLFRTLDKNLDKPEGFWWGKVKENEHADLFMDSKKAVEMGLVTNVGIPHIVTSLDVRKDMVFEGKVI